MEEELNMGLGGVLLWPQNFYMMRSNHAKATCRWRKGDEGWFMAAMPLEAVWRQEVGGDLKGQSGDFGSSNHGEKISDFNEDSNKDKESSGDYGQNKTCFTKQNPRDDCAHIVKGRIQCQFCVRSFYNWQGR